MSDIQYQKIELHSTYDLVKDHEIIEYEKEVVEKLMMENQIGFTIEIEQKKELPIISRKQNIIYVLTLIVRKDDLDKVIELLDKEGNFGYYIDLDSTYNQIKDSAEIENQEETFVEIPEELKGESIEDLSSDPIKMYGEAESEENKNLDTDKIKFESKSKSKFNSIDYKLFPKFIMKLFLFVAFIIILIPEIVGIVYGIQELEYEIATAMFVLIVIETPIFIGIYKFLNKKKK